MAAGSAARAEDCHRRRFLALMASASIGVTVLGRARAQPVGDAVPCKTVYIAGHERHAGIIVDRRDAGPVLALDTPEFRTKDWLEIGWGDADFYQDKGESILLGLKALFVPTGTVVHVYAFNGAPPANFPKSEVIALSLTEAGYARLLDVLKASFKRDADGKATRIGPGFYGLSFFYDGAGTYHAFHTCNTWTAEALAAGGLPIDPDGVLTVGQLMDRVRGMPRAACADHPKKD